MLAAGGADTLERLFCGFAAGLAGKVAGLKVSRDDAAKAVKAELIHG